MYLLNRDSLNWLYDNSIILSENKRGIERESLRINSDFTLPQNSHPEKLGSALTHPLITTDFAENLLEFITPPLTDVDKLFDCLEDLHKYTSNSIADEILWPMSFPYFINQEEDIKIANYGCSNEGKYKSIYRRGLKNRYGANMQTISGIHYNFSFSLNYWKAKKNYSATDKEYISNRYFAIIRNYYRYGWLIPYLFGASPIIPSTFFKNKKVFEKMDFIETEIGDVYLEYATSLRLSNIGYSNDKIKLNIIFSDLDNYISHLKKATRTENEIFAKLGLKDSQGNYKQLNCNQLQLINEYYAAIRPKRAVDTNSSMLNALRDKGVEYLEIRSIDVNPYSPVGISKQQVRLLDLFLVWCELVDSPFFTEQEFDVCQENWNKIILYGRKNNISVNIFNNNLLCNDVLRLLFKDFKKIALILDQITTNNEYTKACNMFEKGIDQQENLLSSMMLNHVKQYGFRNFGVAQASKFKEYFQLNNYQLYSKEDFINLSNESIKKQLELEKKTKISFAEYLSQHNSL